MREFEARCGRLESAISATPGFVLRESVTETGPLLVRLAVSGETTMGRDVEAALGLVVTVASFAADGTVELWAEVSWFLPAVPPQRFGDVVPELRLGARVYTGPTSVADFLGEFDALEAALVAALSRGRPASR